MAVSSLPLSGTAVWPITRPPSSRAETRVVEPAGLTDHDRTLNEQDGFDAGASRHWSVGGRAGVNLNSAETGDRATANPGWITRESAQVEAGSMTSCQHPDPLRQLRCAMVIFVAGMPADRPLTRC